jgi:hypothetical protein
MEECNDYREIKSLEELQCVRRSVEKRLREQQALLRQNVDALREVVVTATELLTLLVRSFTFLSRIFFLRRVYVWVRSFLRSAVS